MLKHIFFVIPYLINHENTTQASNVHNWLEQAAKRVPYDGKAPLDVKVGIYMESLSNFRSTEMSFDVDLYLYMSWKDPSLNHTDSDYMLINDPKVREYMWFPDLYFANARNAYFHKVTVPNFSLFIAQDGTISSSTRVTLNVACNLHLKNYPMDHQACGIKVLSYAHIAKQVNVTWYTRGPVRWNGDISLPEFAIKNMSAAYCDGTYVYAITDTSYKIDRFSCLEAKLYLQRSIGYHLVQSYCPTGLIVIISWVSFWIDRRAVPARVTLSFTTLLTLSTLGNGLRYGLPQVSYAKAIDYWFGVCMIFVFMALLEFALVNSYMRRANKYEKIAKFMEKRQGERADETSPYLSYVKNENGFFQAGEHKRKISPFNNDGSPRSDRIQLLQPKSPLPQNGMANTIRLLCEISARPILFQTAEEYELTAKYFEPSKKNKKKSRVENPLNANEFVQMALMSSRKGLSIDRLSRVLFPLNFLLFNLVYWWYYMWFLEEKIKYE